MGSAAAEDVATADKGTSTGDERAARLRALQLRARQGKAQNRKELYAEDARLRHDARESKRLEARRADAEEKLARMDAEDAGEDFDRRRAWDATIEELQEEDAVGEAKKAHHDELGYVDYGTEAARQYDRNMSKFRPDVKRYNRSKRTRSQSPDRSGLQLAQRNSDGTVSRALSGSGTPSLSFVDNKPRKQDIDRLVKHMGKVDAARQKSKQQRDRRSGNDGSYINDHNRRFNDQISRAYDKYTEEIRDSFDRATRQ